MTTIAWWSGGVTSAVAIKKHLDTGRKATIFFCETGNHHSDNQRFKTQCEAWYEQDIITLRSTRFANVEETIRYSKYINGPDGAKCTRYLKKDLRIALEKIMVEGLNAKFPCRENALAITKLEEALMWLNQRTINRMARGVEGKSLA